MIGALLGGLDGALVDANAALDLARGLLHRG
jgi:hypothetical protein